MIWNYIYDFFIQYIFGGYTSDGSYFSAFFSKVLDKNYNTPVEYYNDTSSFYFEITDNLYLPIGNILSAICTIICVALIVWFAIWLVIWVFKLVAHAFLLK